MDLVDIGVNLANKAFRGDLEDVVGRARAAGVRTMIVTGTSVAGSENALSVARAHGLLSTAGVHPHDASRCDEHAMTSLRALLEDEHVVAVGECGLDFNRDFSPRPVQERCLEAQVELACTLDKPLFLHERDAHDRLLAILDGFHGALPSSVVVHCFTGTERELEAYLSRGFHIGITGWICDDRRGQGLRQLVGHVPLDRLMLETDAPYLTPRDIPGVKGNSRNEPAYLPHIARTVARCMGLSPESVAAATTATARRFFRL